MKAGDLIKRKKDHLAWDDLLTNEEEQEIGIMLNNDEGWIVVHWPVTGISWEDIDTVEKANGN